MHLESGVGTELIKETIFGTCIVALLYIGTQKLKHQNSNMQFKLFEDYLYVLRGSSIN